MDRIKASVEAGLNVLADKPWVIRAEDLPKLEAALETATRHGLVAYDIMTERYEITTILQKELVNEPSVFGAIEPGTLEEPGVYIESIHHLMKMVAGAPNLRPAWFFDIHQQGEGLTDVGTHLVDMAPWKLFPEQPLDYRKDIQVLAARRWPTVMTEAEFKRVTAEPAFPAFLAEHVKDGRLNYYCNTQISYTVRGVHIKLDVLWNYEAPEGTGDTHFAIYRGSRSRLEVRQGAEEKHRPELYVIPNTAASKPEIMAALRKKVDQIQGQWPGVGAEDKGDKIWITIPDKYYTGHEAHFAEVTDRFLGYLKNPKGLPAWENANMLAKYYVTTKGVELSQKQSR
jgi:predicted dehydrogenase